MNKADLNPETLDRYKVAFNSVAKNGKLEVTRIIEAIEAANEDYTEDDICDALNIMGIDNTPLTFDQFVDLMLAFRDPNTIKEAFGVFDKNHKGTVEEDEVRALLRKFAPELKGKEIEEILERANASNNGKLNYDAFIDYWAKA